MSATPCPALTKPAYIARAANRLRQNKHPADPTTIDFDLREDALPENFMRADITTTTSRHIIFATDEQLATLKQALVRRWNFQVDSSPFQAAVDHKCVCKEGRIRKTGSISICVDVWAEKEGL